MEWRNTNLICAMSTVVEWRNTNLMIEKSTVPQPAGVIWLSCVLRSTNLSAIINPISVCDCVC